MTTKAQHFRSPVMAAGVRSRGPEPGEPVMALGVVGNSWLLVGGHASWFMLGVNDG